jgi:tripartite-type tricarboxylate transporter receptor subunit TctC
MLLCLVLDRLRAICCAFPLWSKRREDRRLGAKKEEAMPLARRAMLCLLAAPAPAWAQPVWPSRPVRLIVSFAPGASADLFARAIAPRLEARFGQAVVVENRPGAGGNIGVDAVAKAAPDGHTLGVAAAGALSVNPVLQPTMPYDVAKDLAPVALALDIPFALIARPTQPATLSDLIAAAKASPDTFAMAHGGNGTGMHLAAALFLQMADLQMPMAPFRGSAPAATAVLAGDAALGVVDIPASLALIESGRLRALAVTGTERMPALPAVPTMREAGLHGYESVGWFGVIAPAGTPAQVVQRVNVALREELAQADLAQRLLAVGAMPHWLSSEDFTAFIRAESAKYAALIRSANIQME